MAQELTAEGLAKLIQHAVAVTTRNPDGHLTTDDFTGHQRVKLYWSRTCSLYDLQKNPDLRKFRVQPGAEQVFMRISGLHPETREPMREGDLSKGIILNMRNCRVDSNFPVDFGINVSGVHGMVATEKGDTYAFIAPKGKSREPHNENFYLPKSQISRELLARFNDIAPEKLRQGTWIMEDEPLAAVDNRCTIASMIRIPKNAASLGVDLNDLPIEGEAGFFTIDKRVVQACLARYEEEQNLGFHDMRNFELTFTRIDSPLRWDEPAGVCDNIARRNKTDLAHTDNTRLHNKYTISGEIEIELNLYGKGTVPGSA